MSTIAVIPCPEIRKCQVIDLNPLLFSLQATQSALWVTPESGELPNSLDSSSAWSSSSFSPRSSVSTASSWPSISTQNNRLLFSGNQAKVSPLSFTSSIQSDFRFITTHRRWSRHKKATTKATAVFFIPEKKCFLILPRLEEHCCLLLHSKLWTYLNS